MKPKILLTGGHLSPLLAVLDELQRKADCVIAGRKYTFEGNKTISLEYEIFKEQGIKFYNIPAARLQRKFTKHTIPSLFRFPKSLLMSFKLVKKEKPDVVVTFGGYIGLPIALAASFFGIPIILHEQTQKAGLTSKIIGKLAKKVCVSFPSSERYFHRDKVLLTGNPIRKEVLVVKKSFSLPKNIPVLFITGGSTGSHNINTYVEYILPKLLEHFVVIHQTGDAQEFKDYDRLNTLRQELSHPFQERYILKKFILPSEIGFIYQNADVVLSRSGANTVSELLALQKKALLIPLSHGQGNEQLLNAKYYEESGLGHYIQEKDIQLENLVNELLTLQRQKIPVALRNSYKKDAAYEICSVIFEALNL